MPHLSVGFITSNPRHVALLNALLKTLGPNTAQSWQYVTGFASATPAQLPRAARFEAKLQPIDSSNNLPKRNTCADCDLLVALEEALPHPLPQAGALMIAHDPGAAMAAVQSRAATTPFALHHRAADGTDTLLFEGDIPTKRTATQTQDRLIRTALALAVEAIETFAQTGTFAASTAARLPAQTLPRPSGFKYGAALVKDFTAIARRRLRRHQMRWSVGYIEAGWEDADLKTVREIPNPAGRFFADPFVVTHEGQTAILLEDLHYSDNRGRISAVRLEGGEQEIIPDILDEPCHLSFPYPFEYQGKLYMIPETGAANAIRLYECTRFPDKWVYRHDLIAQIAAVDTMVFETQGAWWMLTNTSPPGMHEFALRTMLYRAENPITGPWELQPGNPIATGAEQARNGGIMRDKNGAFIRVRQRQGFNLYGAGASLARIEHLSPNYTETPIRQITPDFLPGLAGTHHMHSNGAITVFDFVRETGTG